MTVLNSFGLNRRSIEYFEGMSFKFEFLPSEVDECLSVAIQTLKIPFIKDERKARTVPNVNMLFLFHTKQ